MPCFIVAHSQSTVGKSQPFKTQKLVRVDQQDAAWHAMKQLIWKLTNLTYSLSSVNRATLHAEGEVSTSGWTEPQLDRPRVADGILHLDFVARPLDGNTLQVIAPISAEHAVPLGPQPQEITVHAATNELSLRLPATGDGV